jgi:hypothetical protein
MVKNLPILTVLVGLALAITPWVFRFSADHVALIDATGGGIVVAALGALTYQAMSSKAVQRPN